MKNIIVLVVSLALVCFTNQTIAKNTSDPVPANSTAVQPNTKSIPIDQAYQIGFYQGNISGLSSQPTTVATNISTNSLLYRTGNPSILCPQNYTLKITAQPLGFGTPLNIKGNLNCSISDASLSVTNYTLRNGSLQINLQAYVVFVNPWVIAFFQKNPPNNDCDTAAQQTQSVTINYNLQIFCQPNNS